jgi:regulator of sigma E protease
MAAGPAANVACAGLLFALYHLLSGQCTLWHAPAYALHSLAEITTGTFSVVFNLARGHAESGAIAGPVGIAAMAAQAMQHGIMAFLYFIGVLSVSLGCMNLLPLPALDGGQLVMLGIERLRGKPLHARLQQAIGSAGLALFLILTILVTYRDIVTLT